MNQTKVNLIYRHYIQAFKYNFSNNLKTKLKDFLPNVICSMCRAPDFYLFMFSWSSELERKYLTKK